MTDKRDDIIRSMIARLLQYAPRARGNKNPPRGRVLCGRCVLTRPAPTRCSEADKADAE